MSAIAPSGAPIITKQTARPAEAFLAPMRAEFRRCAVYVLIAAALLHVSCWELQFDEAEPLSPTLSGTSCAGCKRPIYDAYFEINGKVVCGACRRQIEARFHGGSAVGRVIKAIVFGVPAAIVGAVLYLAILVVIHAHISLVAVAVGYIVGRAVRKGSENRGGPFYQCLAVFLTYTAIGLMVFADRGGVVEVVAPATAWDVLRSVVLEIYSLPVTKAKTNLIVGLIYCFGLWEAWRITTPAQLVFNGPFQIGAAPKPSSSEASNDVE
jgi:hypothetical protein